MESLLMTVPETAKYLRVSVDVVYKLAKSPGFPAAKIGGLWRVPKEELDKWVLQKVAEERPQPSRYY